MWATQALEKGKERILSSELYDLLAGSSAIAVWRGQRWREDTCKEVIAVAGQETVGVWAWVVAVQIVS